MTDSMAQLNKLEEVQAGIAALVRQESREPGKLTNTYTLSSLIKDFYPGEEVHVNLEEMIRKAPHRDIHLLTASKGAIYLYSSTYLTEDNAEKLLRSEELRANIAAIIREESQNPAHLTGLDALNSLPAVQDTEDIELYLDGMAKDGRYRDIQKIIISTGAVYLYSETFITKNYAAILGRAAANDPAATIAETVREESKIYPRPTNIDIFKGQVFNISPGELEAFISKSLKRDDFHDIKVLRASTGARYLYSSKYLNADYAMAFIEWQEVGEENNP